MKGGRQMTNSEKLFLILAEELNFRRAAARAFLSQQGLSDHIRRLEECYGTPLFYRRPRVSLTPAGEAVQRTLQRVKNLESGLEAELAELEEGAAGTLRLGTNYARARLIIPLFFVQYHARYPKVRLELVPGETSAMERMLENGELDGFLGVNTALRPGMKSVPLARESIYLIASVSYLKKYLGLEKEAIAGLRSGIDLKHFQGLPFAMNYGKSTAFQLIDQHLVTNGVTIDNLLSVSDYNVLEEACRTGYVASFCPQIFLPTIIKGNRSCPEERFLCILPVRGLERSLRFDLVYQDMVYYPKFAVDCFALLKEIVGSYLEQTDVLEQ